MAKTTSDLIVERLLEWGVDTCFGICGDAVNGFFEALRTHADRMRFVHVRHEENAALAAVGYAKFTGRPAANPPAHTSTVGAVDVPPTAARDELKRAGEVLNSCARVAIVAGAGARRAGDELEQVAELLAAPIIKAGLGKDAVPDDSPLTTGGMGIIGTRPSHEALENCDGLLIIGSATAFAEFWPQPGQARAVQIDRNPARIALRYPAEVGLVGDAKATLVELAPLLSHKDDRSFLRRAQQGMREWSDLLREQAHDDAVPMRPQAITWHLGELLPDNAIVTGDAGSVTM